MELLRAVSAPAVRAERVTRSKPLPAAPGERGSFPPILLTASDVVDFPGGSFEALCTAGGEGPNRLASSVFISLAIRMARIGLLKYYAILLIPYHAVHKRLSPRKYVCCLSGRDNPLPETWLNRSHPKSRRTSLQRPYLSLKISAPKI
jgi:hypothetical protein